MLVGMTERGPDSAGLAWSSRALAISSHKLSLFRGMVADWKRLRSELGGRIRGGHAISGQGASMRCCTYIARSRGR